MKELEEIDISIAKERPEPTVQFLVLRNYVDQVKEEILEFSRKMEIAEFASIELGEKIGRNPREWVRFLLTLDWTGIIEAIGVVSGLITIGRFVHGTIRVLRKWRKKRIVEKIRMNCTASISVAIEHLRDVGARIKRSQTRLVYLSKALAFYCVAIFASPIDDPEELHVVAVNIEGEVFDYHYIRL